MFTYSDCPNWLKPAPVSEKWQPAAFTQNPLNINPLITAANHPGYAVLHLLKTQQLLLTLNFIYLRITFLVMFGTGSKLSYPVLFLLCISSYNRNKKMQAITHESILFFAQELIEEGRGGKINYWLGCSIYPNLCYTSTLKFFSATHLNLYLRSQLEEISFWVFFTALLHMLAKAELPTSRWFCSKFFIHFCFTCLPLWRTRAKPQYLNS